MKLIAQIISIVSNPLVLSSPIAFALVYKVSKNPLYSLRWTIISLIFAMIVGLFVYIGMRRGIFSNFDVSIRTERKPVFIFAAIIVFAYLLLILLMGGPQILAIGLGVLLVGVVAADLINSKIKASMHLAVTMSFSLIYALLFSGFYWLLPIFMPPIVAWSRVKLRRHTPIETLVGAIFGMVLVGALFLIVK